MQAMATSGFADPSFALLSLELQNGGIQKDNSNENIHVAFQKLDEMRAELHRARERAREAEKHAGFWHKCTGFLKGDLANFAGLVAATAVVVGTGGTGAAVLLACAASGLSLGAKLGEKVGLPSELCMGLALTGAALGVCLGNVGGVTGTACTIATGARCVQGGAIAASGATDYVAGRYSSDALNAHADGKQVALRKQDSDDKSSDELLQLGKISRNQNRNIETVMGIQRAREESRMKILSKTGGV